MSRSAVSLLRELANRMGELSIIRSSAIGTASQVVSNELDQYIPQTTQNMAAWVYCTEGVNAGYERRARAYAPSADTLTLHTAFPNATESGVEYELHARTQRARKLEALNSAIGQLGLYWPRDVIDTSRVGIANQHEYRLSSGTNWASITDVQLEHIADEDPYTDTHAARFSGGNSLSRADNLTLSTGAVDFLFATWVKPDAVGASQVIAAKDGGSTDEWELDMSTFPRYRFVVYVGGIQKIATAQHFGTPVAGEWTFVLGYFDSVNNLVGISVNGGPFNTTATGGPPTDGTSTFWLGRNNAGGAPFTGALDATVWMKSPTRGIPLSAETIRDRLYNDGAGVQLSDLSEDDRQNFGIFAWWDHEETSGDHADSFDSQTLTNNSGVTAVTGITRIFDPSCALYPYDDARDLNWDVRHETSPGGIERWTLVFGDVPTENQVIRVTGTAFFSELAEDADVLPTGGLWEGAALDWIYDWAKYRLLDETVERQPGGQAERYRQRAVDKLQQAKQDVLMLMKPKGGNRIVTPWSRSTGRRGGINLAEFNIMGLARDFS